MLSSVLTENIDLHNQICTELKITSVKLYKGYLNYKFTCLIFFLTRVVHLPVLQHIKNNDVNEVPMSFYVYFVMKSHMNSSKVVLNM